MMLRHDKQHSVNARDKNVHYNEHHGERYWGKMPPTIQIIKL